MFLDHFDDRSLLQVHKYMANEANERVMGDENAEDPFGMYDIQKVSNDAKNPKKAKIFEGYFHKMLFKFYATLLSKTISKHPESIRLRLIQVNILQNELSNEFKAYFLIETMIKEKPPLDWQFYLYQAR